MSIDTANTGPGLSSQLSESVSVDVIIHLSLHALMISHTFLSLLIPLIISVFYFSSPHSRQRPLFILNITAIFLGVVVGAMMEAFAIHGILSPLNPWPLLYNVSFTSIGIWQSIFVDLILLVRLISVYPPRLVGLTRFSLVIMIPVLLKLTRIINMILFIKILVETASQPDAGELMSLLMTHKPYLKVDWAAQMVDNTYASVAFLGKIHDYSRKQISINTFSNRVTLAQRMRTLSQIALSNFVVPTVFSIVQFVSLYHGVQPVVLNQLVIINTMLTTFGVTFATLWAGSVNKQDAMSLTRTVAITVTHYEETIHDDDK